MEDLAESVGGYLTNNQKTRLQEILGPKFPEMSAYEIARVIHLKPSAQKTINEYLETKSDFFRAEVGRYSCLVEPSWDDLI